MTPCAKIHILPIFAQRCVKQPNLSAINIHVFSSLTLHFVYWIFPLSKSIYQEACDYGEPNSFFILLLITRLINFFKADEGYIFFKRLWEYFLDVNERNILSKWTRVILSWSEGEERFLEVNEGNNFLKKRANFSLSERMEYFLKGKGWILVWSERTGIVFPSEGGENVGGFFGWTEWRGGGGLERERVSCVHFRCRLGFHQEILASLTSWTPVPVVVYS